MYYFIVNPNSRSGRGRSIWNEIHQQLMLRGIDFQYCLTRYSGHAAEIASAACSRITASYFWGKAPGQMTIFHHKVSHLRQTCFL